MDDYSEIAFECILQPSVLDTKVFGISTKSEFEDRKTSVGILLELLTQLCSVTKTQIAVNIEGMVYGVCSKNRSAIQNTKIMGIFNLTRKIISRIIKVA